MRYVYPNELYHYGVLGMKWGVRLYQNKDGSLTALGRQRYGTRENYEHEMTKKQANDADKQAIRDRAQASKNRRTMTMEELNSRIERYKTEKQLKDLTKADIAPGLKAVEDILSTSAKAVLTSAAKGGLAYFLNYAINKKGNSDFKVDYKKLAEYVASNPNKKK